MIADLLNHVPEVVVVGDVELFFLGAAAALGSPKLARKVLRRRYPSGDNGGDDDSDSDAAQ